MRWGSQARCSTGSTYTPDGYTPITVQTAAYNVPGMSCAHCVAAVEGALAAVPGVEEAHADLDTKLVEVRGADLRDEALRAAIEDAGYEAER